MHSAHELLTRWPALDVAAKRARLTNSLHLSPGLADRVWRSTEVAERAASGLWRADPSVWSADSATQHEIGQWLGWMNSPLLVADSLDRLQTFANGIKAAGVGFENMVFINPYLTGKIPMSVMNKIYAQHFEFGNTPARATIQVAGLPSGANIEFTGVAVMDLAKRKAVRPKNMEPSPTASPCVFAGDTLFCSAKSGFIPGVHGGIYASTVETQLRQTMRNLLDGLEEAGMNFSNVVASNVYLDDVEEFSKMNGVYAEYFGAAPPARTTIQQAVPGVRTPNAKGIYQTLEQISIVAVK